MRVRLRVVLAVLVVAGALTALPASPVQSAQLAPANVESGVVSALRPGEPVSVVVMLDGHHPSADVTRLRADAAEAQADVLGAVDDGVDPIRRFRTIPAFTATVDSEEALLDLAAQPGVAAIGLDDLRGQGTLANTVPIINADALHTAGFTGQGATVAVLDSGIDADHPDLAGATIWEVCFGEDDFVNPDLAGFCPNGENRDHDTGAAADDNGHGTAVTGVVASDGDVSSVGVAPDASIVAVKILDSGGTLWGFSEAIAALDYLANSPGLSLDIVNMSFGTNIPFSGVCDNLAVELTAMAAVIANLRAAGVLPIAVSGNDGSTTQIRAPGCLSGVVAVGATDVNDLVAGFSNTNNQTDVMAPGDGVVTDELGGGVTGGLSGTSVAAPAVAGCAALIEEAVPAATPDQVERSLEATGVRVRRSGVPFVRINCEAAQRTLAYPAHGYTDVASGSLADLGLRWAKDEQVVIANFPDGGYHPGDPVNRGQIVNMLWTLMGSPPGSPPHGFVPPDVPTNAFYNDALDWARAEHLVTGYTRREDCRPRPRPCYKPRDPVLRGQLVNMAWNMVGAPTGLPDFTYTDVTAFRDAFDWADHHGLLNVFGTQARPRRAASRAEVIAFLHRVASVEGAWSAFGATPPDTVLF